jgi:hypothetical protein
MPKFISLQEKEHRSLFLNAYGSKSIKGTLNLL